MHLERLGRASQTFIKSSLFSPTVILNYHRIQEPLSKSDVLSVTPDHFRQQMQILKRSFDIVSHDTLFVPSSKLRVAITVDDGYADFYYNALPVVEELGIPISLFITTGFIGSYDLFWWDELEHTKNAKQVSPKMETDVAKQLKDWSVKLQHALPEFRPKLISEMKKEMPNCPMDADRLLHLVHLDEAQIRVIAKSKWVTIGSHTRNHLSLEHMSDDLVRSEMSLSKRDLESLLGTTVQSIAYPYGSSTDISPRISQIAKECGYSIGFTTVPGVSYKHSEPMLLPRMFVQNWDAESFKSRVKRFVWIS